MTQIKLIALMLPQPVASPAVKSAPSRVTLWGGLGAWLLLTFVVMWVLNPIDGRSLFKGRSVWAHIFYVLAETCVVSFIAIRLRHFLLDSHKVSDAALRIAEGQWDTPLDPKAVKQSDMLAAIVTMQQRLRQTQADLQKVRIRAEEAAEFKSLFLANISHEIRTP
jgi:signal transduction histidine kinase